MSTHAEYIVWAGVWGGDLTSAELEGAFEESLTALEREEDKEKGLVAIRMHGEVIGWGRVLFRLDWVTNDEKPQRLDLSVFAGAEDQRAEVEKALRAAGLPGEVTVGLYHHLDLG